MFPGKNVLFLNPIHTPLLDIFTHEYAVKEEALGVLMVKRFYIFAI